ncbi:MAG: hypothetical protein R6V10_05315 [bacterium]
MSSNKGAFYISLVNLAAIIVLAAVLGSLYFTQDMNKNADSGKTRKMAAMLEARGLYKEALDKMELYRQSADLNQKDEARLLYRMGKIAQDELDAFERAAAYYTMATTMAPEAAWKADADKRTVVCLEKSGRSKQSRALLRKITGGREGQQASPEGQKPEGPVVAVVDGTSVYWSAVQKLADLWPEQDRPETYEDRKKLVREYMMKMVMAREAVRTGLDTAPEVKSLMKLYRREALTAAYLENHLPAEHDKQAVQKLWQEATDLYEVNIFHEAVPRP